MVYAILALAAANIALWVVFFLVCKKAFSADAVLGKIRGEVNALLMDIRQETDMSATLIEGRTNALKRLIEEADSRTLLAQKTEENREREQKVIGALAPPPIPPPATYAPPKFFPVVQVAPAPDAPPDSAAAPQVTIAREQITPKKSTKTAVLDLAAEGFTPDAIAERLDVSITEVRMIVNLYGV